MEKSIPNDVDLLRRHISAATESLARVVLMIVSGLPGTGKSYFSRRMAERAPLAIVETDAMRNVLFPFLTHSGAENGRHFKACHSLIDDLLNRGISVLFDATNLVERNRKRLYNIADKTDAKLIIVRMEAPPEVVAERLRRGEEGDGGEDNSTADLSVYSRMVASVEPIRRDHSPWILPVT
ncbi:MAG: ATP-binding protein [Chloroflexi bacterium]|nr:ATP-binding protein [Chloroflexota bacterium]